MMTTPVQLCLIAVGGALGALTRYGITLAFNQRFGTTFPWGTFVINATGSLLLGLIYELFRPGTIPASYLRPLIGIGFIGAYTTFSTFEYETFTLGLTRQAFLNMLGSVVVGYGCVLVGIKLGALIGQAFGMIPRA